jgi:hypothetical protein
MSSNYFYQHFQKLHRSNYPQDMMWRWQRQSSTTDAKPWFPDDLENDSEGQLTGNSNSRQEASLTVGRFNRPLEVNKFFSRRVNSCLLNNFRDMQT